MKPLCAVCGRQLFRLTGIRPTLCGVHSAIVEGSSTLKRYSGQEHSKSRLIAYVVFLPEDARLCVAFDLLCMEQGRGIGGTAEI